MSLSPGRGRTGCRRWRRVSASSPAISRAAAAGVFAVIGLSWGGWLWYQHLPHPPEPERITFTAPAPAITDYAPADGVHKIVIHPLDVKFSASAAPIELVGKTASKGITMTPALKGTWSWIDDRTLHFVPAQDWPVGAHVEVEFNVRQAFAPHVLMADDHFAFDMPGFLMTRGSGRVLPGPHQSHRQEDHHDPGLQLSGGSGGA